MSEPFSENSPRQAIQQSGQSACPPPDIPVNAQSVYQQSRHTNNQISRSLNRPINNYQPAQQDEYCVPPDIHKDNCDENRNGKTEGEGSGASGKAKLQPENTEAHPLAYHTATPYPPIKVSGQNPQYAAAMLDNMAGQNSEMSAVGLYFYDQLMSAGYKEVSDAFRHISIVEMRHLEIFSQLAMQLGENPRLWSRQPRSGRYIYWTPACLRYPHIQPPAPDCTIPKASLRRILSQAIEAEQAAVKKYMNQTTWIKDINLCDNLRRIAADEQMHADIYTRLYHTL